MADQFLRNDRIVSSLRFAIREGNTGLSDAPGLLKMVLREEMWRERIIPQTGEVVKFDRFIEFVTTPPLEGLGADVKTLQRLCVEDKETLDLIDRAVVGKQGGNNNTEGVNQYTEVNVDIINIDQKAERESPTGTSSQYALRRLRKSRPDLHAQVIAGELSPHAAMVEAGFRRKQVSFPAEPKAVVDTLLKTFDREQLTEISRGVDCTPTGYTIRLTPDVEDGGYSVSCDQIPAVHTQGCTLTAALRNAADAIELCLEFDTEHNIKAERGEHP